MIDGLSVVGLRDVAQLTDQSAALRFVAFIDRVYDAELPIRATGLSLDLVFPDEMLAGGYRKKYLRAISRLVASTLDSRRSTEPSSRHRFACALTASAKQ